MNNQRPRSRQKTVLRLEPKRAVATIFYAIILLIVVAMSTSAALYRTDAWPDRWRFVHNVSSQTTTIIAIAGCSLAVVLLIAVFVNGRRWRLAVIVERLSKDPDLAHFMPDDTTADLLPRARVVPAPLEVRRLVPRKLPKPRSLRPVTGNHNVVGGRPLSIAYLRLFENEPRTRTFIQGAWREFGYVYLLRSAASVTPNEYQIAKRARNIAGLFVASRNQFIVKLDQQRPAPSSKRWRAFKDIAPRTIRVWDRYGSYPLQAFLCHGAIWRAAVDDLLHRVDLVVLDLSGFMPSNLGTGYELQRVVDRFPIDRVIFLADEHSDLRFLSSRIQQAWQNMADRSPNSGVQAAVASLAITDHYRLIQQQTQQGQQAPTQVRLIASRRQSRRLAAAIQERASLAVTGTPDMSRSDSIPASSSVDDRSGHRLAIIGAVAAAAILVTAAVTGVVLAGEHASPTITNSSASIQQTNTPACTTDVRKCVLGDRIISLHSSGPDVTELQQRLHELGFYRAQLDGDFGLITEAAVKGFQTCVNLTADGIVGPTTISAIRQATPASVAPCLQAATSSHTAPTSAPSNTSNNPSPTATPSASPPPSS
jgi:hypothetical protein